MEQILTTLAYLEKDGRYLMLYRNKKKNDINEGKWIGVGGHLEEGETPESCLLREVYEETGLTLTRYRRRGDVFFHFEGALNEVMYLYTADGFTGELKECDEGELEWIEKDRLPALPMWEGDRIFFDLIGKDEPFFRLELYYNSAGALTRAVLNGRTIQGNTVEQPVAPEET